MRGDPKRSTVVLTAVASLLLAATGAAAQRPSQSGDESGGAASVAAGAGALRVTSATRAAARPVIDGSDADPVWVDAVSTDGFRQYSPEPDADPSFATRFEVAYDDDNLYVFVRAFDPHPDSIMRALTRRDQRGPSDQIGVYIDSYDDRRTGFTFWVNPDGVQRDFSVFNDGEQDSSWNGIWDVATRVDSLGWTAEFLIPLSQLRYNDARAHTFGFGVRRDIERYNEQLSWPLYSRTTTGLMSQLGRLGGLEGLGASRRVELTPYAVTSNRSLPEGGGFGRDQELAVGADLKIGITPNITLDATVNPDFGQVEADPAVLNLGAFETFLGERRPFFLEGTGLYRFSLNCYTVVDCNTNEGLFYSRRIGRAPSLSDRYGDDLTPSSSRIALAGKLTGRTPGGLSFGWLDAVTEQVEGTEGRTVEPRANYAVARAQQDLRGGDASIGWIATAVNRSLDEWTRPYLHESAYVTGVNARTRFGDRNWEASAQLSASRVAGSSASIARTQRGAVHYYQQPGDDLVLDTTRTALSGHALQLKLGKNAGGITRFETSLVRQSPGFDVNDLGYLRRADILDWSTWAALSFQTPTSWYRWAQVNGNTWHHWTTSGLRIEQAVNFNAHVGLHNNWNLHAGGTLGRLGETYCDRCTRGGPALRQSRALYPWFGVNGDSRRPVVPNMWVNLTFADEGRTRSTSLSPSVDLRFSPRWRVNLGTNVTDARFDTQWYGNFTDALGETHHTFAHLEQRTVSLNTRVGFTATPDLTFEMYAEPFASSGAYTDVREVSDTPDAERYADRFRPYAAPEDEPTTFSFVRLKGNAVMRWEYRPGSTLFLVWQHGREDFALDGPRNSWRDDFGDLFGLHPENTFLIKVAYWLNR